MGSKSKKNDGRFKILAELLPGAVFEIDAQGTFVFASQTGLDTFGFDEQDLKNGLNCIETVIPDDRKRAAESLKNISEGSDSGNEYTGLRKDGSTFPILIYMSPIHKHGKLVGFRGLAIDTSEFKKIQKELEESEKKYRLVVENASEGLIITGQGKFFFANPKACELLGYSLEELLNKPYLDLVYQEDHGLIDEVSRARRRINIASRDHSFICRFVKKSGEIVWLEITGVPIVWDGEKAWLNFVTDITQRKVAQDEALLRAKLQAAVETAGATCHELNQPLQAVVLMTDLMMMQMDRDDPLMPRMKNLRHQVRRMSDITHRLNRITAYRVKDYIGLGNILDLESIGPEQDEEKIEENSGDKAG